MKGPKRDIMYDFFNTLLSNNLNELYSEIFTYVILVLIVLIVSLITRFIIKIILVKAIQIISKKTKSKWDDLMLESKLFHRLSNLAIPIVVNFFKNSFPSSALTYKRIVNFLLLLVLLLILDALITSIDKIYKTYPISKIKPISGLFQVLRLTILILGIPIMIAILLGESPLVLLGGFGAMTAVLTLIFKDAILGFVAGIQLTANDMIRIGDWIEMPKNNADGDVIDMTLTTVKVQNWDKTIVTIPAYALVSESFINWRGMQNFGGRRIKRAIYLDVNSVQICDQEMIDKFKKVELLKEYILRKQDDIDKYNKEFNFDTSVILNGRRMTNIGTFRAYVYEYLKEHPGINEKMTLMVRQLNPTTHGIPLEVYAFTDTIIWTEYEGIQSDIFDHLYAAASFFSLTIFQDPSGKDMRSMYKGS